MPPSGKVVQFTALDGVRLEGVEYGTGRAGVVLTHQLGSDASEWAPLASMLAERGYRALALNVRGTCPRNGFGCSRGSFVPDDIWQDVAGGARFLLHRGARNVILVGGSMGGEASLVAAARFKSHVAGVVSLSGSEGFAGPIDPHETKAIVAVGVPKLFIAGRADTAAAAAARDYDRLAKPPKQLLIVGSAAHGVSLLGDPRVGSQVTAALITFLAARAAHT
jgi:pimeloyl-ACP methyl ester carboxylesterase